LYSSPCLQQFRFFSINANVSGLIHSFFTVVAFLVHRSCAAGAAQLYSTLNHDDSSLFAPLNGDDRTHNQCEAWNRGFAALVGHNHPSAWCAIESLQRDVAAASTTLLQNARGQPPAKRVKTTTQTLQHQLHTICAARRDGQKTVEETLRAVAHTVRFE